jgi:DNA gyrase subunit A
VASDAQILRTPVDGIATQGRTAKGVVGMKLRGGATVLTAAVVDPAGTVLTVSEAGGAKLTELAEVPSQGRAAGGVRLTRLRPEDGPLRYALVAPATELSVVVGQADAPDKADPNPVALTLEPTRRDGGGLRLARPIHAAGKARW